MNIMKTEYTILYESPEVGFLEIDNIALCNASYGLTELQPEEDEFLD